jgi:hypothetical protein
MGMLSIPRRHLGHANLSLVVLTIRSCLMPRPLPLFTTVEEAHESFLKQGVGMLSNFDHHSSSSRFVDTNEIRWEAAYGSSRVDSEYQWVGDDNGNGV